VTELREIARKWANDLLTLEELAAVPVEERAAILADQEIIWRRESGKVREIGAGDRVISYVMSVEKGVGHFKDVIIQSGWDFSEFEQRGRPFLWAHNLDEIKPWLGRIGNLDKSAKVGRFNALTGDAEFTPLGMNEWNDGIHAMVAGNFMPGFSVGFRIKASRLPKTEAEKKKFQLGEMSSVFEECMLVEGSSVPIGMDPDANAQRYAEFNARLMRGIESGEFRRELADELRGRVYGVPTKTVVPVPGLPFAFELVGDELRAVPAEVTASGTVPNDVAAISWTLRSGAEHVNAPQIVASGVLERSEDMAETEREAALEARIAELEAEMSAVRATLDAVEAVLSDARDENTSADEAPDPEEEERGGGLVDLYAEYLGCTPEDLDATLALTPSATANEGEGT